MSRVEDTELSGLGDLSVEEVYEHIDSLSELRPGPVDLYKRWERQQWSASALDFTVDREQWQRFDPYTRTGLDEFFTGFFVGEQAVTDTLSPLVMGAPDLESRLFLSTQLVDEARHSYFFDRFYEEVVGLPGSFGERLDRARSLTSSTAFNAIFERDLVDLTDAVRLDPSDYGKWVEAVCLYHFMVEGILALVGQRMILQVLKANNILPAFRAGFTAVTRDESRHVSFAVWALRVAIEKGFESNIASALDRSLENCIRIYANPEFRIVIPKGLPPQARMDPRKNWRFAIESLSKRLRAAGVNAELMTHVEESGWKYVWAAVEEYESRWDEDHPVREWERGEIGAS